MLRLNLIVNILFYFYYSSKGSKTYLWKNNWKINYVQEGIGPPLLLVPGFGVGTFHYNRNIKELSKKYCIYSLDLLGQGRSWPDGDVNPEQGLCYSIELWRDQILYFIENIIQEPVHIAGNSLGGYLSVATASTRPASILSVTLLNPTPFWAFNPPISKTKEYLQSSKQDTTITPSNSLISVWDGTLPAPNWILQFGSRYFDLMRRKETVSQMLGTVYTDKTTIDSSLIDDIINSASNIGGHEAFTSILFSPKYPYGFDDMLAAVGQCRPVCLVYGRDDPWIVPYWGQRAKRVLPNAPYLELTCTGHCPHHESPTAVNNILDKFIEHVEHQKYQNQQQQQQQPHQSRLEGQEQTDEQQQVVAFAEDKTKTETPHSSTASLLSSVTGEYPEIGETGRVVRVTSQDGKPRNLLEWIGAVSQKQPNPEAVLQGSLRRK